MVPYSYLICSHVFLILILSIFLTSHAQGKSNPVFHTTVQSDNGPNIIEPFLEAEKVFEGPGFFAAMAFLGPDDVLVVDKNNGTVHRIINGNMLKDPLLDVNVANRNERGLVGMAIDQST